MAMMSPPQCGRLAILSAVFFLASALAETITRHFDVGWVSASPDGALERPTIGVNGQWPLPLITATVGDRLVLTVHNDLGNASTSMHFHGFFQNGTNYMDGAVGVTQCAIPPGSSFTYEIDFAQAGTYWYHAHNNGQYMDGLRGPIVVHDPRGPYEGQYDKELVLTFSDWYHKLASQLIDEFISVENPTGTEPVPQAALMNDTQNLQVKVQPGKTYLIRIVNMGAFAAQYVWFEGHKMRLVEVDGVWTEEAEADRLYIMPAQRYSVLLTTRDDALGNFPIVGAMDKELFDDTPEGLNSNVTGWLVYDEAKPLPLPVPVAELDAFDDMELVPYDREELFEPVDHTITLNVKMDNLRDGANYAFFNDKTYAAPKVPSLYTALTVGTANATDPRVYGTYTIPYVLEHNDIIEVVLNNGDDGKHPFHLHGHNFQVVYRSGEGAGRYNPPDSVLISEPLPRVPMRRDTVFVEGDGNFVLRFRADNPGVQLFHCHLEWHMDQGLVATFVEAPEKLQGMEIPEGHLEVCRAAGALTQGNAAGHTADVFDLRDENRPPLALPEGFTPKGYVALFFSCAAAVMGMAVISWYGVIDASPKERSAEARSLSTQGSGQ